MAGRFRRTLAAGWSILVGLSTIIGTVYLIWPQSVSAIVKFCSSIWTPLALIVLSIVGFLSLIILPLRMWQLLALLTIWIASMYWSASLREQHIKMKNEERPSVPDASFLSYTTDTYTDVSNHGRSWSIHWEYIADSSGRYRISNLYPYCSACNCNLVPFSEGRVSRGTHRAGIRCPRCGKEFFEFTAQDRQAATIVIASKIDEQIKNIPSVW